MATEFTGTGDPARSMALLWRTPEAGGRRPGPRSSLDVDRIVAAAVTVADAEGLSALSMRRVAADLGVATMTLYSHVPGKGELVDLMLDSVLGKLYEDDAPAGNWRARLEAVARANWDLFLRHPWAVHLSTGRPPLGPHLMRKYELELRAVDGLGLGEVQMDLLVTLLNGFVRGSVSGVQERVTAEQVTGITEDQWWTAMAPHAERFFDAERFPTAARVGPAAGNDRQAARAPERSFEFGLERLLDGIGVLILNASR
ncbi:TetR/AcrR family transcriptional regulator C-terminal domain-containing protein [Blastococcus sp. CT_GayMR16]|uniref:TetR/AcrR family transcriptional regulator C-terminal domain-containing protein n=1 Tax=Blastococcus sp. CT_GayMR16 TaxID=2559607 RepID=UPI001073B370|nr:TetR/AcrR family transcriptional regulator C-terminal domain-containing protein [Blastococcus sp. CT_GayMR16]TFV90051.1 TetR/AcrR family transcriptional regulator [Blastococcus sp. CT_GayMR16]